LRLLYSYNIILKEKLLSTLYEPEKKSKVVFLNLRT
jgi:hypothetical protein